MTSHVWDGYCILANRRAWSRLPDDLRAITEQEFDRSAADERADIQKLSVSLREDLTAKGLKFNDVDQSAFRQELGKTSFYQDWKGKYGDEAWVTSSNIPASWCSRRDSPRERPRRGDETVFAKRNWAAYIDSMLRPLVEIPAAILVLVEIGVLLAGVTARYVLHDHWSGRTSWPRSCSCGSPCWGRWWPSSAASTCA